MRTIDIPPDTSIEDACEMAVKAVESTRDCDPVGFEFDGFRMEVHEGMTPVDVMFDYEYKKKRAQKTS